MARQRPFDPLSCLPSPEIVEQTLAEAEARAEKLRTLLRIVREVESAGPDTATELTIDPGTPTAGGDDPGCGSIPNGGRCANLPRSKSTMPLPANGNPEKIRLQQARVLRALLPTDPSEPPFEWPLLTRANLCLRAGFKLTSGSITRVLNGIRPGNRTSGAPHPGLVERALVEEVVLDIDGVFETNYRITAAGIRAYEAYLVHGGTLPAVKDATTCTNGRYRLPQGGA